MLLPITETRPEGDAIDAMPALIAAEAFVDGQLAALEAVRAAAADIDAGAAAMAGAIERGGSLVYAAAGSSGLMALADACELTGTFGIPNDRIAIHMAGGVPADGRMPGGTEDDGGAARHAAQSMTDADVLITLSASGTTPYALDFAKAAKANGASVIGIACNPGAALLDLSDIAICLETPPEVIAGSTRLGAGTAQKAALNLMSTLMGIRLGHVYQGQMVNVMADNAKLIQRAARMVSQIANVGEGAAQDALAEAGGQVKPAILIARGSPRQTAMDLLQRHAGRLDACLEELNAT
ncbi:MAG: N-acetylmuramic acid 6-phosphate etherase [Pseudomonadota bacterium]